ncbi:MAG: hypothetical protein ACOY9Y_03825 [Bacillota bacterium]
MDYSRVLLMELEEAREALEKAGYRIRVSVTGSIKGDEPNLNLRVIRLKMLDHNQIGLVAAHFEHPDVGRRGV